MRVLFAVNNDNVSEAIAKKYQNEYKEILSYKNVYYFNAIIRELQKDKNYDRIVISEDLEPFANNNYDMIDKFLFDKYSNITEEAKKSDNDKIEVILICADRRKKSEEILIKIYNVGIYNAIIGQDRSIDEVCKLIYKPKNKAEARVYYNIQISELAGQEDNENSVSEAEVENILAHYKRLGKNEDKYVDSFNNIISQYTDIQLKIIIKYLPIHVKAVLEERSPKYQQLVTSGFSNMQDLNLDLKANRYKEKLRKKSESKMEEENDDIIEKEFTKPRITEPIIIPSDIKTENVKKVEIPRIEKVEIEKPEIVSINENGMVEAEKVEEKSEQPQEQVEQPKRGRGRPRKNPLPETNTSNQPKRGRGRPRKENNQELVNLVDTNEDSEIQKPDNSDTVEDEIIDNNEEINLFNIEDVKEENDEGIDLFNIEDKEENDEEIDLFNIEDDEEESEEVDLFNIDNVKEEEPEEEEMFNIKENREFSDTNVNIEENNYIAETNRVNTTDNLRTLLTSDKKIVSFVGTTKNGTSFIVNNTAEMLATMGISTAILDMTKTKNAYYIYTNNEEELRNISLKCMRKLENGIAEGIKVNKNLTVYTEMPGEEARYDIDKVLSTLIQNHSAVLIDTDFETPLEIFAKSQELYLVQTMDVLTIQPLTAFLRNLKSKDILKQEKLKIVINKSQKIRSLNVRTLIGGMSCYNAPNMSYMTELFDRDNIRYCEIPFEIQNYVKYLESLVNCSISLNGYTKLFISALRELANMVYPLVNKQNYSPMNENKREPFSLRTSNTLNKMKNKGY